MTPEGYLPEVEVSLGSQIEVYEIRTGHPYVLDAAIVRCLLTFGPTGKGALTRVY